MNQSCSLSSLINRTTDCSDQSATKLNQC